MDMPRTSSASTRRAAVVGGRELAPPADDAQALLEVLPPPLQLAGRNAGHDDLIEIVMDLGRGPEAPTFDCVVEMVDRDELIVHKDTAKAVDRLLCAPTPAKCRKRSPKWSMRSSAC